MGNICSLVLFQSIGCFVTKKQLSNLILTRTDTEEIRRFFLDDTVEQMEDKLREMIGFMVKQAGLSGQQNYFQKEGKEFAVRIHNAIEYDVMDTLFLI